MANFYLAFKTMKNICESRSADGMRAMIDVVSKADELSCKLAFNLLSGTILDFNPCADIALRRSEKKVLNELNVSSKMRFPVLEANTTKSKKRLSAPNEKIVVLVNEALSEESATNLDFTLNQVNHPFN